MLSSELLDQYLRGNHIADTLTGTANAEITAPSEVSSLMKQSCPFCGASTAALDIPHLGVFEFDRGTCGTTCRATPEFLPELAGFTQTEKDQLSNSLRTLRSRGEKPRNLGSGQDVYDANHDAGGEPLEGE